MTGAQGVRALARRRPADPLTLAGRGGEVSIERSCEFEGDQRAPEAQPAEETGVDLGRLLGTEPDLDLEPGRAQAAQPLAGDARIRVLERHDHAPHTGGNQGIDAGRRTTPMAA